jgi:hypothetical protein
MKIVELLETLGPHERQELELMLKGNKPAAIVFDYSQQWKEAVTKNGWIVKQFDTLGKSKSYVIAKQAQVADGIVKLFSQAIANGVNNKFHIELGRLLGYSTVDIAHFLASSTAKRILGPVLGAVQSAARVVGGVAGVAATLATHSGDVNAGEDEWLARHRARAMTTR